MLGWDAQYIDSELSSDVSHVYDVSDTTIEGDQNKVTLSVSDAYDLSDVTSANTKTLPAFKTEHNTKLSDVSDLMVTDTKKMADMTTDEQNPKPSDISDTYDTAAELEFNSEQ